MIQTSLHDVVVMLISKNLHKKSSKVSIKTRSTPASLSFTGQVTKHTIVKWTIATAVTMPQNNDILSLKRKSDCAARAARILEHFFSVLCK